MRVAWQRICLMAVVSAVVSPLVFAQSQPLETEYKKLIKVDTDISPLGATPFGENVSLYDGSLSFEQTDLTLKGTGPDIVISRTFNVTDSNEMPLKYGGSFADWDLNTPRIETYTANQLNVVGWILPTPNPMARCSQFTTPPVVDGIGGTDPSTPDLWWYGSPDCAGPRLTDVDGAEYPQRQCATDGWPDLPHHDEGQLGHSLRR